MYRCKICGKKYTELTALYNHIESKHKDMIPKDMSVQQYYYFMKTGKTNGNCVMCKNPTGWNHNTGKYNRFCGNPKCKDEYVKIMKSRMVAKYGKTHLLNDPNKQREMLANRSISGVYKWSDGKHETTYTGSYELDFLRTLDNFFDWDPEDISMPSPHTYTYKYEGEDKFYIPDVFIHSLDLEIEIKDGGDNPNNHHKIQDVDKEKERLKDEVLCSQKAFHYIKITNKNYENLFRFLKEVKQGFEKYGDETKIPRIFKIEDIKGTSIKPIKESTEIIDEGFHQKANELIVKFDKFSNVKYKERDYFFSLRYDLAKNNPKEMQKLLTGMIKAARFEDDIWYIRQMSKKADDYYQLRLKKHPEMKDVYGIYYDWIKDGGMDKEIKRRRKDFKLQESNELIEESYIINTMKESSISIPQMNYYLQNEYEEEMKNYLNTYKKYYNLMLKEQPAAVKHINEDIRQCLIVIDGLASKGVENNLVQFAKDDLGEIVKASKKGKPVKVVESIGFKIPTSGDLWISTDWHFYKNKDNTKFKVNPNIDKILNNYKKCVKSNDTFIFLGDLYDARTIFDMKLVPKIFDIKKLKGHKIMIKGNHDVNTTQFYLDLGFDEVYEKTYNIGNIVFSHEPVEVNSDKINIHGHIHFSETYWGMEATNHLDAYIEHYNFKPVKINDIINEYRNTHRITQQALNKFDSLSLNESMVSDITSIDDKLNDISLISVCGNDVSISNEKVVDCKIVYDMTNSKNSIFTLTDTNSKLIIENLYVIQRDKVGTHCSISPLYNEQEGENILEFQIILNESVDIQSLNNKLNEGVNIANLHKFNDKEFKFIKESCMKLFGVYPKEIKIK